MSDSCAALVLSEVITGQGSHYALLHNKHSGVKNAYTAHDIYAWYVMNHDIWILWNFSSAGKCMCRQAEIAMYILLAGLVVASALL